MLHIRNSPEDEARKKGRKKSQGKKGSQWGFRRLMKGELSEQTLIIQAELKSSI